MKKLTLLLIFVVFANSKQINYEQEFQKLSKDKKDILVALYKYGKEYGYEYTIPALAWQESSVGEYLLNVNGRISFDCGYFQANTKSVLNREGRRYDKYTSTKVCQKLMTDIKYALVHVTEELMFWENLYPNNWMKIWTSYNKGYRNKDYWKSKYAISIRERVRVLRKHLRID